MFELGIDLLALQATCAVDSTGFPTKSIIAYNARVIWLISDRARRKTIFGPAFAFGVLVS